MLVLLIFTVIKVLNVWLETLIVCYSTNSLLCSEAWRISLVRQFSEKQELLPTNFLTFSYNLNQKKAPGNRRIFILWVYP